MARMALIRRQHDEESPREEETGEKGPCEEAGEESSCEEAREESAREEGFSRQKTGPGEEESPGQTEEIARPGSAAACGCRTPATQSELMATALPPAFFRPGFLSASTCARLYE